MNREQMVSIIQQGHYTDGDLADSLLAELTKEQKPFGYVYMVNGSWYYFDDTKPPEDAYDEGTLVEVFTLPQPDLVAEIEQLKAQKIKYVPVSNDVDRYDNHPNDKEPRSNELREEFRSMGDDCGQGLSPYWKWAFASGWNASGADQLRQHLSEAQANIEMLRESLKAVRMMLCKDCVSPRCVCDAALAATPESSLREHDAKLVERIASEWQYGACSASETLMGIADRIRKENSECP